MHGTKGKGGDERAGDEGWEGQGRGEWRAGLGKPGVLITPYPTWPKDVFTPGQHESQIPGRRKAMKKLETKTRHGIPPEARKKVKKQQENIILDFTLENNKETGKKNVKAT